MQNNDTILKQQSGEIKDIFLKPIFLKMLVYRKGCIRKEIVIGLMESTKEIIREYCMHHHLDVFKERCNCLQYNRINLYEID